MAKRRPVGRPAGGSEKLIEEVLDAAFEQLLEQGYARLSVEEVADAVGVNKTTVYRRWPTKSALVLAAVHARREAPPPFVASGVLRKDLVAVLLRKARALGTQRGRRLARALTSIEDDTELAQALRAQRFVLPTTVIREAIAKGQLPKTADADWLSEMLLAPVAHRAIVLGESVDRAFVERVVDAVLAGAK